LDAQEIEMDDAEGRGANGFCEDEEEGEECVWLERRWV